MSLDNPTAWERDERTNERDKKERKPGTTDSLYDASGEPRSDEWWDKKLKCICCFREEDGFVFANIDCPIHGALHGKNPYGEEECCT